MTRPLVNNKMPQTPTPLNYLIEGYKKILEVGADAQYFIRDELPDNASPMNKWGQEVLRRTCRRFARANVPGIGVVNSPIWGAVCDPYLDSISEGPTSGGSYSPPFTGGQCSNVQYEILWYFDSAVSEVWGGYGVGCIDETLVSSGGSTLVARGVWGPISYGGTTIVNGDIRGIITYSSPQGVSQTVEFTTPLQGGSALCPVGFKSVSGDRIEVQVFGSGIDDCGDPPNQYNPPQYPPDLPTIGTPTNPAPGLGDDWDVTINPDGTFNVCYSNQECTPNINPDGSTPDPSEDPGEEDGDPNENNPNDPTDDITGCASEGQILTGIKIEITQIPVGENPGSGGFYRNVCWVWMGPSQDQLDLVTDGKFLESGQFVIPDSNNCRCYRVRPSPLWGLSVQAYSRPEKED